MFILTFVLSPRSPSPAPWKVRPLLSVHSVLALANKCYFPQGLWAFDVKNSLVMEVIDARKIKTEEGRAWDLSNGSSCCELRAKAERSGVGRHRGGAQGGHSCYAGRKYTACLGDEGGVVAHFVPDKYSFTSARYKQMQDTLYFF